MAFTDKTEKGFETLIVNWLVEQNGYEQGTNVDGRNATVCLTTQKEARAEVHQGKGITENTVQGGELALVVNGPDVVWRFSLGQRWSHYGRSPAVASGRDQSGPVENLPESADGGPWNFRGIRLQISSYLLRPPPRVVSPQVDDFGLAHYVDTRRVKRSSGPILE